MVVTGVPSHRRTRGTCASIVSLEGEQLLANTSLHRMLFKWYYGA